MVAYAVAPIALAVVVDRVVAVIRRHVMGADEPSAWTAMGRAAWPLRGCWERSRSTRCGSSWRPRRPLPGSAAWCSPRRRCRKYLYRYFSSGDEPPPTKKAALLALYRVHPDYGNRSAAAKVAAELAPHAGLQAGTARAYLYAELEAKAS